MYRVKMEVYFDIDGTNAEVVDAVRNYEMRNLAEFDFLDILFGEPMVRPLRETEDEEYKPYELLTEECDVFSSS
jgi:hypothetical protein|tara:strand:- start:2235 stop:2456 length:222 start_codon:yes stop_codon:yes gene_type:complete